MAPHSLEMKQTTTKSGIKPADCLAHQSDSSTGLASRSLESNLTGERAQLVNLCDADVQMEMAQVREAPAYSDKSLLRLNRQFRSPSCGESLRAAKHSGEDMQMKIRRE